MQATLDLCYCVTVYYVHLIEQKFLKIKTNNIVYMKLIS